LSGFLSGQLDFIFFFYGMAFLLLAATCWSGARDRDQGEAWTMLGAFAFVHGIGEWLDMTALTVGDTPSFALARTALLTLSFLLLLDFARLEATRLGFKLPGRWIYSPLVLAVVLAGIAYGVVAAAIMARYALGIVGAAGASLVLGWQAKVSSGAAKRLAIGTSAAFALYALAVGLIVAPGPFWPSTVLNQDAFAAVVGVPIQLVRGLLACWISLSIWAIWGERHAADVASPHYTSFVRQQFTWTAVAMGTILVCGWMLTEHLGVIYRENVQKEARTDIELLSSRLAADTSGIDAMVRALAGSPSVLPLLTGSSGQDAPGRAVLELNVEASGARRGFILDRSGKIVASSGPDETPQNAPGYGSSPLFQSSIAGAPHSQFLVDPGAGTRDYLASYPIRTGAGPVIGVAVLAKSLDGFARDLQQFNRPYFLVDPDGVIVMTNRPHDLNRVLWPSNGPTRTQLAHRSGAKNLHPMLAHGIVDASWTSVDGASNYVRRRFVDHGDWSLVILNPMREMFATRFLGIVITLLITVMALVYQLGRGRRVHDDIQLDNRLKLQELARTLGVKATTDPLTGLHNRLKLGPTLVDEMQRAERYRTPLSLVLFDIDHFKTINDTYGHPVGDQVLVELARLLPTLIRSTDLLARWGGEEFLILAPGSDGPMAFQAAEKLRDAISRVSFDPVGSLTCSFGVTQFTAGETAAQFIARADGALYRAKADGRNQVQLALPAEPENRRRANVA